MPLPPAVPNQGQVPSVLLLVWLGRLALQARWFCTHVHDFIALLPLGYDTLIEDEGVRLSGSDRDVRSGRRTRLHRRMS